MRSYNVEKTEKITRTKAIFTTLLVHFALLYGLLYMNGGTENDIMPDFVKEWVEGEKVEAAVASTERP